MDRKTGKRVVKQVMDSIKTYCRICEDIWEINILSDVAIKARRQAKKEERNYIFLITIYRLWYAERGWYGTEQLHIRRNNAHDLSEEALIGQET